MSMEPETNAASNKPVATPQQVQQPASSGTNLTTNALEHLRLEFMTQQEMDIYKRLCASCINQGIIEGIESKEEAISKEISNLNNKIWNYFSQLMNEDCLNSAKPDQFLPMKNILNIKLLSEAAEMPQSQDDTSSEQDLNKQLSEAFQEINNGGSQQNAPASTSNFMGQPSLFRNSSIISNFSQHTVKKKSFGWSQTANTALKEQKKIQSIQQQIQEYKNAKLRNDILTRVQTDFLPSNRLHLEYTDIPVSNAAGKEGSAFGGQADFAHCIGRGKELVGSAEDQINQILMSCEYALGAKTDPKKIQLLAPNTQPHCQILSNSYLSDLDLGQISEHLDIEMAVMLDPHEALKETSATPAAITASEAAGENNALSQEAARQKSEEEIKDGQGQTSIIVSDGSSKEKAELNLNCQYDFRPTNFNFLLLSRFSFATKRRRIQKLIRKRTQAKKAQLQKSLKRVEDMENRGIESRQRQTRIENKTLETIYPKLYRDYIETRVKKDELLHDQGLDLGRTGPAHFDHDPQHLDPQKAMTCQVSPSLGTLISEIPDDIIRAKASYVSVPQPRYNQYTKDPIQISVQPRFKLIEDPMDYEMEFKRRNLWSDLDIKTFLVELLRGPKRFEKIGEALPHKTASEIVFFYHTFKKLLKLKEEIKKSREYIKMRFSQQQQEISFGELADTIMKPLTLYIQNQSNQSNPQFQSGMQQPGGFNGSGYFSQSSFNNGNSNGNGMRSNGNGQSTPLPAKEAKRDENRFNIEQLLQVFSASNFNGITQRRRPPKGNLYASLHDNISLAHQPAMGLYQHDTYKIRPEFLGVPSQLGQSDPTPPQSAANNVQKPSVPSSQAAAVASTENATDKKAKLAKTEKRDKKSTEGAAEQSKKEEQGVSVSKDRTSLQKVDYLEYLEQTGEKVINMFLAQSGRISQKTSEMRKRISAQKPEFSNLDNDSWRKVNYLSPQQQQIRTLLEHQRRLSQREAFVSQEGQNQEAKDGLHQIIVESKKDIQVGTDLKCKAHGRNMDFLDYWNFQIPISTKVSKKKQGEGFTQYAFAKLEKKAETHQKTQDSQAMGGPQAPNKRAKLSIQSNINNQAANTGALSSKAAGSAAATAPVKQNDEAKKQSLTFKNKVGTNNPQQTKVLDNFNQAFESQSQGQNKDLGQSDPTKPVYQQNTNQLFGGGNGNDPRNQFTGQSFYQQQNQHQQSFQYPQQQQQQHQYHNAYNNNTNPWQRQQLLQQLQQQRFSSFNDQMGYMNQQNPNFDPQRHQQQMQQATPLQQSMGVQPPQMSYNMPQQPPLEMGNNTQEQNSQISNSGNGGGVMSLRGGGSFNARPQMTSAPVAIAPPSSQQDSLHQAVQSNPAASNATPINSKASSSQPNKIAQQSSVRTQAAAAVNNSRIASIKSITDSAGPSQKQFQVQAASARDNSNSALSNQASNSSTNQWTPQEKNLYISCLIKYGKNFPKIAESLPRRTVEQCRNYFQNYKKKDNLMTYVKQHERNNSQHLSSALPAGSSSQGGARANPNTNSQSNNAVTKDYRQSK